MRSYIQVLTTPTADTPGTTLMLHFDNKRYLLGSLAEGTQRACVQMGARLLKVSEVFLTGRTEWSNMGGLLGMILTLADSAASSQQASLEEALARARSKAKRLGVAGDRERMRELEEEAMEGAKGRMRLTVFGPPNLNHCLATARRFVFRKGMPVDVHEIREGGGRERVRVSGDEWEPYWADENVKVWAMSVLPDADSANAGKKSESPSRPRKRSIDEVYDQAPTSTTNGSATPSLAPADRDLLAVKAVVGEMFDSSWRLDTLYETPLSEVRMPASIFVRNTTTNKVEKYTGPLPGGPTPLPNPDLVVLVRRPWPGALIESLPDVKPAKEAVSYIFRNHLQRGKFRPEDAVRLKVEKGHKWASLAAGESVLNTDGETITPEMVLGQSKQGGGIAVVDVPTPAYIGPLLARPEWQRDEIMAGVGAIFWICGAGVAEDERVEAFMKNFANLEHIVSAPDLCKNELAMDSSAASTVRLSRVDPKRYRVPVHDKDGVRDAGVKKNYTPFEHMSAAKRGLGVQLEPTFALLEKGVAKPLEVSEVEVEMSPEVLEEAEKAREVIEGDRGVEALWASSLPDKDAEIITLGTGSALPSKYRNVSATLLRVPSWGNVLFDAGENTLGQLKRVFEPAELKQVLQDLRIIFISHMHADHHLGTVSVIKAWYHEVHSGLPAPPTPANTDPTNLFGESQRRLAIISEPAMQHWLIEYSALEDYGFSRIAPLQISPAGYNSSRPSKLGWFVPPATLSNLAPRDRTDILNRHTIPPSCLNLTDIQAVAVQHCHGARAVSLTLPSGFKASYSGDCRPSQAFAKIGRGSTVVVHEATFDDELLGDAQAKNHSTTSEALGVAQAMGARSVVLTHFSQRYQKMPVLEHATAGGEEEELGVVGKDDERGGEEDMMDAEDEANAPLEDAPVTFPDQVTANGDTAGQQYDLPSKRAEKAGGGAKAGPEAVKFKLHSDMRVAVAFDYMRVKVGEIGQLEKFTPALLKLFAEEEKKVDVFEGPAVGGGKEKEKKEKKSVRRN